MSRIIYPLLLTLLLFGCNEDKTEADTNQTPPLITAAESGDITTLKELLEDKKANAVDVRDSCQFTPLMKAALNGHTQIVEQLLAAKAKAGLEDKGGYTALLLASSNNHHAVVEQLLLNGANINHTERTQGLSALIWSAKRGHLNTVKLLLGYGANKTVRDYKRMTALDWAIKNNHKEIAQLLTPENK